VASNSILFSKNGSEWLRVTFYFLKNGLEWVGVSRSVSEQYLIFKNGSELVGVARSNILFS